MAIVKMNKLSIIGLSSEKEALLRDLMELGVVELKDQSDKLLDQQWAAITRRDGDEDQVSAIESRMAEVQTALDAIDKYDTAKKPLFKTRRSISESAYQARLGDGEKVCGEVSRVLKLYEEWSNLKTEENTIISDQASLKPWASYELPLEYEGSAYVKVMQGIISAVADAETLKKQVEEVSEATEVYLLGRDEEQQYLCVFCMREEEDAVFDVLKNYGFTAAAFKGMKGTVSENMERLDSRLSAVREEQKEKEKQLSELASLKEDIQIYYDSLIMERDKAKASENFLKTGSAFCLEGWMVADSQKEVEAVVEKNGCVCEITVPEKGEETPVLLKNTSALVPFEAITSMYALPRSYEVDPTPIFAAFYFIFFGMMFADMGYGLILAVACFAVLKLYPLEGTAYRLIKCLGYCGVSTFIWGALFGGFLGNIVTVVSRTFFGHEFVITPLWFDPLSDPMKLLIFSCVLGTVHLFVGMGIKAYMYIRDGKIAEAIIEVFAWYFFIIGLALLLFGGSLFEGASGIGKWLAIIGAVIIVGGPLIRGKGIGRLLGLWDIYGTTSYLADILSYSRLLALGLASAVIAQVFNELGSLFGGGIAGAILFIIIAVVGHVINFAINALGSYVHTSRLQYVEFFGKFYEGGGDEFQPFTKKTKYVKIVKEEK